MKNRSDYTNGERVKVGAYVDDGIYTAFRQWVQETNGRQYSEVGTALERAMLEYMDDGRVADHLVEIKAQTRENAALLRKLGDTPDTETREKERGKRGELTDSVPQGKNPGDRELREMHVIETLYKTNGSKVSSNYIKDVIRGVAGVKSDKTVRNYLESITQTPALETTKAAGRWSINRQETEKLLESHGIELDEEVE